MDAQELRTKSRLTCYVGNAVEWHSTVSRIGNSRPPVDRRLPRSTRVDGRDFTPQAGQHLAGRCSGDGRLLREVWVGGRPRLRSPEGYKQWL
eukprot:scaffold76976_cov72-Phaeocystis_antarctica.AAC.1